MKYYIKKKKKKLQKRIQCTSHSILFIYIHISKSDYENEFHT